MTDNQNVCEYCKKSIGEVTSSGEKIYELFWQGPLKNKELKDIDQSKAWKLYSLYCPHPIYGQNALCYIGMSKNAATGRMRNHKTWFDPKLSGGQYYAASIWEFCCWEASDNNENWEAVENIEDKDIKKIEALLIYSLQPTFNSMNKNSAKESGKLRLFNTGNVGDMPYEVSSLFNLGI